MLAIRPELAESFRQEAGRLGQALAAHPEDEGLRLVFRHMVRRWIQCSGGDPGDCGPPACVMRTPYIITDGLG